VTLANRLDFATRVVAVEAADRRGAETGGDPGAARPRGPGAPGAQWEARVEI